MSKSARTARLDASRSTTREAATAGSLNDIHKEPLMGSMLKFDSDRRELVRERRNARIERKQQRRQARERKHSHTADVPSAPSAAQLLAERELRSAVDGIVIDALDRHER
ncbi:MAG: hypothetical protein ACRDMJ_14170, partial [Solirubrobacteraceae bacterium]